jgi:hypothetical protein
MTHPTPFESGITVKAIVNPETFRSRLEVEDACWGQGFISGIFLPVIFGAELRTYTLPVDLIAC